MVEQRPAAHRVAGANQTPGQRFQHHRDERAGQLLEAPVRPALVGQQHESGIGHGAIGRSLAPEEPQQLVAVVQAAVEGHSKAARVRRQRLGLPNLLRRRPVVQMGQGRERGAAGPVAVRATMNQRVDQRLQPAVGHA